MVGQDLILCPDKPGDFSVFLPPSLSLGFPAPAGNGTLFYTTCWFTHMMSQQNQNKSPVCYGAPVSAENGNGLLGLVHFDSANNTVDQNVTMQRLITKDFTTLGCVSCCWQRTVSSAGQSRHVTRREKGVASLFLSRHVSQDL